MTDGQRQWMLGHIADGLRTLGIDVTPTAVERELQRADAMLRTASGSADDFVPPDPYAAAIERLRKAERTQPPLPTKPPLDSGGIPDPYAEGLRKLREERNR